MASFDIGGGWVYEDTVNNGVKFSLIYRESWVSKHPYKSYLLSSDFYRSYQERYKDNTVDILGHKVINDPNLKANPDNRFYVVGHLTKEEAKALATMMVIRGRIPA